MRWIVLSVLLVACATNAAFADECREQPAALAKRTMAAFGRGMEARDLRAFLAQGTPEFSANSPDAALAAFRDVADAKLRWSIFDAAEPVLTTQAAQGDSLRLEGFYATSPSRTYFTWVFDCIGAEWRVAGAEVRVKPIVKVRTMRHNGGWTVILDVLKPVNEIFYALPDGEFESSGFSGETDDASGRPMPKNVLSFVTLPKSLRVRLDTPYGPVGPVAIELDEHAEVIAGEIGTLETTQGSWAYLRTFGEQELLYFTHLVGSRCAIAKVRYSLDSERLDREYALPECDWHDPGAIPDDMEIVTLDAKPGFIAVQLEYVGGKRSKIVRIPHS